MESLANDHGPWLRPDAQQMGLNHDDLTAASQDMFFSHGGSMDPSIGQVNPAAAYYPSQAARIAHSYRSSHGKFFQIYLESLGYT